MGRRNKHDLEYLHRRYMRLERHRIRRKNKKHNLNSYSNASGKINNVEIPKELELLSYPSTNNLKIQNIMSINLQDSFSITNNPIETIKQLKKIATFFLVDDNLELSITCNNTTDMDMSALILLDLIIVKGSNYITKKGFKCKINGDLPKKDNVRELFVYSGLPKHLDLLQKDKIPSNIEILNPFTSKKDTNLETDRIINYYNSCLKKNGYQLNDNGKSFFYQLINEIVDNAKLHNGYKDLYFCGGFYSDTMKKGQLSIISLGNSMYESLNGDTTDKKIKDKIKDYISYQKKFFDINYKEETSWTVYALQYKISRYNNINNPDRGTGTIRFIEAFMQMGKTSKNDKPKMSLLSGKTHIIFDGKYNLKEEIINGEKIKVIAFNENNNLKEKPDSEYVKCLSGKFPGVIINVEFYMDKRYLENFKEEEKDEK